MLYASVCLAAGFYAREGLDVEIVDTKVKMGEVGLGSSANVEYVTKGEKNFLSKMTFVPAKGE